MTYTNTTIDKSTRNEDSMNVDVSFKAIGHFLKEQQLKVHRFTNNLKGLQNVMVNDFS